MLSADSYVFFYIDGFIPVQTLTLWALNGKRCNARNPFMIADFANVLFHFEFNLYYHSKNSNFFFDLFLER